MSALDDIEAATAALNALTAQEAAQAAAISAAVAAALAATVVRTRNVYIDAVAGTDTNDGSAPTKAVATLAAATALLSAGQRGALFLLSDVTIAAPLPVESELEFYSYGVAPISPAPGSTIRTVNVQPGACGTASGFALPWNAYRHVGFNAVNLAVGAVTQGRAIFGVNGNLTFGNSTFTFDDGMTVPLISDATFAQLYFYNVVLPPKYPGRLIAGVTAGANPNSPVLQSNLTSA